MIRTKQCHQMNWRIFSLNVIRMRHKLNIIHAIFNWLRCTNQYHHDTKVLKIYVFSNNIMCLTSEYSMEIYTSECTIFIQIYIQVSLKVLRIFINPGNTSSDNMNCLAKQLVDPVYFWKTERDSTCTNMEIAQIGRTDEPVVMIFKNCTNIMRRKQ